MFYRNRMAYTVLLTTEARKTMADLQRRDPARYKKVRKALRLLAQDPGYPSLHTHRYEIITGPLGQPVWESYVENHTPSAWRIWWYYGPEEGQITIFLIGPHP